MTTKTEEATVDFDAIDREVARGKADAAAAAPAEDEITVETAPEPAEPAAKPVVKPEIGIEALKKQLETERAARLASENRERELANAEVKARTETQKTQLDVVNGAIDRLTQNRTVLKAKYAEAAAAGDWLAAADVQAEMADNASELQTLKIGKTRMEKAPPPQPRAPTDPVEAYIASVPGMGAESRDWIRAHPEFARTENGQEMLFAAHQLATRRGLKENTPEYFRAIEKTLDVAQGPTTASNGHAAADDPADDPMADAAAAPVQAVTPRRTAPAAAPVTRNGNGSSSRSIRLTPDQVEMAHASFPDSKTPLEDYARQLAALRKEGRLS